MFFKNRLMFTKSIHFLFEVFLLFFLASWNNDVGFEGAIEKNGILFTQMDSLPDLNKKIVEFTTSKIGTQVGRGECWDFAAEALDYAGAKWERGYVYGRELEYSKEEVLPGDIIQFEKVVLETQKGNAIHRETMGRHTAIVYEVLEKGKFKIAHQNNAVSGRKVGITELNLADIKKGNIYIYRPINNH